MSDKSYQFSSSLGEIFELAKKTFGDSPRITAEKLFFCIIDKIIKGDFDENSEFYEVGLIIRYVIPNLNEAKIYLEKKVHSDSVNDMSPYGTEAEKYFGEKLQEAKEITEAADAEFVTLPILVLCILMSPPENLMAMLDKNSLEDLSEMFSNASGTKNVSNKQNEQNEAESGETNVGEENKRDDILLSFNQSDNDSQNDKKNADDVSDAKDDNNILMRFDLGGGDMDDSKDKKTSMADKNESECASSLGEENKNNKDNGFSDIYLSGNKSEDASQRSSQGNESISGLLEEVRRVRKILMETIMGQDHAINTFVKGYFQSKLLGLTEKNRKRPLATFIFAGSPGVGKTLLAETAAAALGIPKKTFDMNQYSSYASDVALFGHATMGREPGAITDFVSQNPKCFLIFDEIEKANSNVIQNFLQLLDSGRVVDGFTKKEVFFSEAIIVFTTNAGKQLYEDNEYGDFANVSRKVILKALEKDINPLTREPYFPNAICSRFASGNLVMFNRMEAHILYGLAKREMIRHAENFKNSSGIEMEIDDGVYTALLFSEGGNIDARTARGRAETFFNDELYELMRLLEADGEKGVIEGLKKIKIGLNLENAEKDTISLFENKEKTKVLLFAEDDICKIIEAKTEDSVFYCVNSLEEAKALIKKQKIDVVFIDVLCGFEGNKCESLNVEDVESPARSFLRFVRGNRKELPVYIIEQKEALINEEEKISYSKNGIRGIISMGENAEEFAKDFANIALSIYRQKNMNKLARGNKLLAFETSQRVSEDGTTAEIKLFDFRLEYAVEAEDSDNILGAFSLPDIKFDDIIGASDAKAELKQYIEFLASPETYSETSQDQPKGVLLYGPPGTGKTLLAKALASEAGVAFIATEGNSFLKKYVGEGPEKLHQIFRTARKYAPAIVFIDEVDVIGRERTGEHQGSEDVLNALLTEMDGFNANVAKPVFVLAATNYDIEPGGKKVLDGAFVRRFDRSIKVDLPSKEDRINFLKANVAKNPMLSISDENIESIAVRSTGMSLASLASVVKHAVRIAVRRKLKTVNDELFDEAFETFNYGEEKKWDYSELKSTAIHESGHAFICYQNGEIPSYLTIVARGNHGGYMAHGDTEKKGSYTKDDLLGLIRTSLAGRAAELVYYGTSRGINTGARSDLIHATKLALDIICHYGMDDNFGLFTATDADASINVPAEIKSAVNKLLKDQLEITMESIRKGKKAMDNLINELLENSSLTGPQIKKILSENN